jgi:hypothetical protein
MLSPQVKRQKPKTEHWQPSDDGVKDAWSCISVSAHVFMAFCIIKHGAACYLASAVKLIIIT